MKIYSDISVFLRERKRTRMSEKVLKRYLFASDFDQTLTFNDSGYVLSEILGIPTEEFKRKAAGMAKINLVQQGAELAYLLLHDPEFRLRVRREHLFEVGKKIRLKDNIGLLYAILDHGIEGYQFDFSILSAAPVEVIQSALEGVVPPERIYGTQFHYNSRGEIETIVRATAGYGKVAVLDQLQTQLQIGPDHIVYAGDGSSDVHVMLHVNARDGFTIAVSESKQVAHVAKRTVLGNNALVVLAPILENIVGWPRPQIREFLESYGFLIQEWDTVRTDWLTLRAIDDPSDRSVEPRPQPKAKTETLSLRSE
jgi:2-hydroxy-3-keto-5-methylthiopentenyl-1-phosphate phosphatase